MRNRLFILSIPLLSAICLLLGCAWAKDKIGSISEDPAPFDEAIAVLEKGDLPDFLKNDLKDTDPVKRSEAVIKAGKVVRRIFETRPDSELPEKIFPPILPMVGDSDASVRLAVFKAINTAFASKARLGMNPKNTYFITCLKILLTRIENRNGEIRETAVGTLKAMGFKSFDKLRDNNQYRFVDFSEDYIPGSTDPRYTEPYWVPGIVETVIYDIDLTLNQKVEIFLANFPGYVRVPPGPCGTPALMAGMAWERIFDGHSVEEILPLLRHPISTVRYAAIAALKKKGMLAKSAINDAYEKGNTRIKLDLIDVVKPDATTGEKIELLKEITDDPTMSVYAGDMQIVQKYFYENHPETIDDYPFDIMKFYIRVMRESDYPGDKADAINSFAQFGSDAKSAVPALIEILRGENHDIEGWGYGVIGNVVGNNLHCDAIIALGKIGPDASDAIPEIEKLINDEDPCVHFMSESSLYLIGYEREEMLGSLISQLKSERPSVYDYPVICEALGKIGSAASGAVPRLTELAVHEDHYVRSSARNAIYQIEGSWGPVYKICIDALSNENEEIRKDAVNTIQWISRQTEDKAAIPALEELLKDKDPEVRYSVCETLAQMGVPKDKILPALIELTKTKPDSSTTRLIASFGIEAKSAIPALLEMLANTNDFIVLDAVSAIKEVGGTYDQAVERLIELTTHEDEEIRKTSIETLRVLKEKAVKALPALRSVMLNDKSSNVKSSAREAINSIIEGIKPEQKDTVQSLIDVMDCNDTGIIEKAADKIFEIGGNDDKVVDKLGDLALSKTETIALCAIKYLQKLGGKAKDALPDLKGCLNSNSKYVREAAAAAIADIEKAG